MGEVIGALATMPLATMPLATVPLPMRLPMPLPAEFEPLPDDPLRPEPRPFDLPAERPRPGQPVADDGRIVPTGFPALDAILGPGGIPRLASLAVRGDHSSGKTTLALRLAAQAQEGGAIVAWLDLAESFDPVEAVARGVRLEWLVVLTPASIDEGLIMAGALLQGRAVDLLLIDLPARIPRSAAGSHTSPRVHAPARASGRSPGLADRLHRLAALARRSGSLLVVLEPPSLPAGLAGALTESIGLRLELARQAWIRLGRDVIGQRTEVVVARNRFGPPGRRAELRILYAEGGERDACLTDRRLLLEVLTPDAPAHRTARTHHDAIAPPLLASSPAPPGPAARGTALQVLPVRGDRSRRPALDRRDSARHEPARPFDGRPARDAARERAPAHAGGGVSRA